ncbi:MAG: hypothetical protein IKP40_12400 [Clostridia bacterium]|nr:hypothetical protein [Clostridia bacterium]
MLLAFEAVVFLFAGYCIWARRKEGEHQKQETNNLWPLAVFFLCCSLLFGIPSILFPGEGGLLAVISLPMAYVSMIASNCRIRWDTRGFWYRTALRREVRYEYEDVSRMRRIGSDLSRDLVFRAGKRLICLDDWQGWDRFASAYDNWRTQNRQIPWREEEKQRWLRRYQRHGVFGRKLDRICFGRTLLVFALVLGAFFAAAGFVVLLTTRPAAAKDIVMLVVSALFVLAGIAFPAGYIWGVAHMNKRVLRFYTKNRIRPDPLNPEKPKRFRKAGRPRK